MGFSQEDESYMRMALEQAHMAAALGEVPVGAVIVWQGKVLGRAFNCVEMRKDAEAHAEMLVLAQAAKALGDWRLVECTLYVTKEPCAMCAGAAVNARLGRLVFGVPDARCGGCGGGLDIVGFSQMLHNVPVTGHVLEEECRQALQAFFRRRRQESEMARQEGGS